MNRQNKGVLMIKFVIFRRKIYRRKNFKAVRRDIFLKTLAHFCGHFYENLGQKMSTKEENNCISVFIEKGFSVSRVT